MQRQVIIYAFIIANVVTSKNEAKSSDIFENYLYLKNVFDNDLTEVLSEQDYDDHAIDLANNKKLSYMSLYNLSQKKLAELRRYLNDILTKK